jgi:N-acylneuraminate cytidylyltransferase/CMP-N,N'-diacetyllegionaminic acid synthase
MIDNLRVLGVITARGGSKGLRGKNIRPFLGKPLILWTLETAISAPSIDTVIVSTDDEKIAEVVKMAGGRVPFLRPNFLAHDTASSVDVVLHAVEYMQDMGEIFDIVVLLEPTSPIRDKNDIEFALKILNENKAGSVVSICRAETQHPAFMYHLDEEKRLNPYTGIQPNKVRRQDIPSLYFLEGTVYCSRIDTLRSECSFYHSSTLGYEVPKWKSIEIDDIYDFVMAESLMRLVQEENI